MARPKTTKTAQQQRAERRDAAIKSANKKYKADTKSVSEKKSKLLAEVAELRKGLESHEATRDAAIAEAWAKYVREQESGEGVAEQ